MNFIVINPVASFEILKVPNVIESIRTKRTACRAATEACINVHNKLVKRLLKIFLISKHTCKILTWKIAFWCFSSTVWTDASVPDSELLFPWSAPVTGPPWSEPELLEPLSLMGIGFLSENGDGGLSLGELLEFWSKVLKVGFVKSSSTPEPSDEELE